MGGFLGGLLGGSPKVSTAAVTQTEEEKKKAKSGRSALYETEGGVTGQELNPDEVRRRSTLLGN
jgi:hypothetical protein